MKRIIGLPEPHPRFGYQMLTQPQCDHLERRHGCAHQGMAYVCGDAIRCLRCGKQLDPPRSAWKRITEWLTQ